VWILKFGVSLKSGKKVKIKVVRVPFEMTKVFQMKLDSIQPSQLYINSEELRYVIRQLQSKPVFIKPIPMKSLKIKSFLLMVIQELLQPCYLVFLKSQSTGKLRSLIGMNTKSVLDGAKRKAFIQYQI
jgi:hypothetical protein